MPTNAQEKHEHLFIHNCPFCETKHTVCAICDLCTKCGAPGTGFGPTEAEEREFRREEYRRAGR